MLKCRPQIDGSIPSARHKKAWAQECEHYLVREVESLSCKKMILFGDFMGKSCLPEIEEDWEAMKSKVINWGEVELYCLERPKQIPKQGLSSDKGLGYLKKLNQILGGKLTPPNKEESQNLFDIL